MTRVLHLSGGWPGHTPRGVAAWTRELLHELDIDDIEETADIFALDADLAGFDLIILGWNNALTTEDLTSAQESALLGAVENGTGVVGWHGAGAAFRASLAYHLLLGGSFLAHPAGEAYPQPYEVSVVDPDHPVMSGVRPFRVASEQYYMSVDPNVQVLAETTFSGEHLPWVEGFRCPVAWTKNWGRGRVFYHSIGHFVSDLENPDVRRMTQQGIAWTIRTGADN